MTALIRRPLAATLRAMFRLHERLAADTTEITRAKLCRVLLMEDRRFPWLILVPQREGIVEIPRLWDADQDQLWREILLAQRVLEAVCRPDKLNLGALGNLVPQLHIHVVGRFRADAAWPGPVWGAGEAEAYGEAEREELINRLREGFEEG